MANSELDYGLVKITGGVHKGRIGLYDNEEGSRGYSRAVVYFGEIWFAGGYFLISHKFLAPITTPDLLARYQQIVCTCIRSASDSERSAVLAELSLINNALDGRMHKARMNEGIKKTIFLSHSSMDKTFVRSLAVDLANADHKPWLDEWEIKVGQSIPSKVSEGIQNCDVLIVVLSENSTASKWVENEWQAKYWDEVGKGHIQVLPVLLRPCEIPTLLKTKKYADFTYDYEKGFEDLSAALSS